MKTLRDSPQIETKLIQKEKSVFQDFDKSPYYDIIIRFFKSKKPTRYTSVFVYDEIEKKEIDTEDFNYNVCYIYGGFRWHAKDVYHFIKYNMPLTQEFIDYVLEQYRQGKI